MSTTKFLRGECQHCGGHLEFPAEAAGTSADCPHCQQSTDLFISAGNADATTNTAKTKTIIFTALACVILIGGLIGAGVALNRAKRMAEQLDPDSLRRTNSLPANPFESQEFAATAVALEKNPGTSLVHAAGSVKNLSSRRRFGVRIEIELKDDTGTLLAPTKDYAATIEPGAVWNFKAMVQAKGATAAKISVIKEEN